MRTTTANHVKEVLACADPARGALGPWQFLVKHVRTFDNERRQGNAPFPEWPFLFERLVVPLYAGEDIHVEKSRKVMASWTIMGYFLWALLFRPSWTGLALSAKGRQSDDGGQYSTWESLLGKVRYMHDRLPPYLRHREGLRFKYMSIVSPRWGSALFGETTGKDAFRGGGVAQALMDEAASMPRSEQVFASIRPLCPRGVVILSTPKGRGNLHGRIRFQEGTTFRKVIMDWRDRPGRDEKWYADLKSSLLPHLAAQELDRVYDLALPGRVFWQLDREVHASRRVPYDAKHGQVFRFWDFGVRAQTAIVWCQLEPVQTVHGPRRRLRVFRAYATNEQPAAHYAEICSAVQEDLGHPPAVDYGDPAGWQRDAKLGSWATHLAEEGVGVRPTSQGVSQEDLCDAVRWFLQFTDPPLIEIDPVDAEGLVRAAEAHVYPTDDSGRVLERAPIKDESSHLSDALKYACDTLRPAALGPRKAGGTAKPQAVGVAEKHFW